MLGGSKVKTGFLIVLAYFNLLAWAVIFDLSQNGLEIVFFDVGQGDSIFIETPSKHQILIDGGPDFSVLEKLGQNMAFYDRTIDLVILTHPDHDHLAGLLDVLNNYQVENILWTGVVKETTEFDEWKRLIQEEGARIVIAEAGKKIVCLGGNDLTEMAVLHPSERLTGQTMKDINNSSIVIQLSFGEVKALLTGDISSSVEKSLIEKGIFLKADVLKIAHHGSKNSTSEDFLKEVSPQLAVISVGADNSYGHPNSVVLELLSKYGIKILRTDQDGDIRIFSGGQDFKIIN